MAHCQDSPNSSGDAFGGNADSHAQSFMTTYSQSQTFMRTYAPPPSGQQIDWASDRFILEDAQRDGRFLPPFADNLDFSTNDAQHFYQNLEWSSYDANAVYNQSFGHVHGQSDGKTFNESSGNDFSGFSSQMLIWPNPAAADSTMMYSPAITTPGSVFSGNAVWDDSQSSPSMNMLSIGQDNPSPTTSNRPSQATRTNNVDFAPVLAAPSPAIETSKAQESKQKRRKSDALQVQDASTTATSYKKANGIGITSSRRKGTSAQTAGPSSLTASMAPFLAEAPSFLTTPPIAAPSGTRSPHLASLTQRSGSKKHSRERNRAAATKCRAKAKAAVWDLEAKEKAAAAQQIELRSTVAALKDEVLALKNELLCHGDCNCESIQLYLANKALSIGRGEIGSGSAAAVPRAAPQQQAESAHVLSR